MWLPLPWRKMTPLHHQLGVRAQRFAFPANASLPQLATPQNINLRYDASTGTDRIIGCTLSIANSSAGSDFTIQELNTGWFLNFTYPGSKGAFIQFNIETMIDEVDLSFYFSASSLSGAVYLSFQNIEVVPASVAGNA